MTSPNNSGNDQEVQNFKHFLSFRFTSWTHAAKLQENPALANDKGFVKGDKELFEFLNSNPYVQAQFRTDPNDFMKRVQALATQEPRPGASGPHASDYTELKVFLQNHAWIADRLKEDPSRAASKDFLNKSKELREFLETHPYLQDQFTQDPRRAPSIRPCRVGRSICEQVLAASFFQRVTQSETMSLCVDGEVSIASET